MKTYPGKLIADCKAVHGLTGKPGNRKGKGLKPKSRTRSLRLPESLWEALEVKASQEGVSVNKVACVALERAIG